MTRPKYPKTNLLTKNIAPIVIEQIIQIILKNNDKRVVYARSESPKKSFVQYFRSFSNDRTKQYDIEVEVHQEIIIIPKTTIHKIDIALHLEIHLVMTRVLLLHNTLDHDMTFVNKTRDLIAHDQELLLFLYLDQTQIQETNKDNTTTNSN